MSSHAATSTTAPAQSGESILCMDGPALEHFDPAGRSVVRLYTSAHCDLMLVCWEPGQESSYHHHGESESLVQVVRGTLEVRGDAVAPRRLGPGHLVVTPVGVRHQLVNPGPDQLVTLHVYVPPTPDSIAPPVVDCRPAGFRHVASDGGPL